ncbi:MAG TPA: hypothetical protein VHM65_11025, partial [Candidatus Lustribacter sp.]|nr:hypothetical protein [Candidatus Lustribacter sp.]
MAPIEAGLVEVVTSTFNIWSRTAPMTRTLLTVPTPGRYRKGSHSTSTRAPTMTDHVPMESPSR